MQSCPIYNDKNHRPQTREHPVFNVMSDAFSVTAPEHVSLLVTEDGIKARAGSNRLIDIAQTKG
jgi:translation initiation factor 2B subunit (eIF-2B alpha/beta/delta family)